VVSAAPLKKPTLPLPVEPMSFGMTRPAQSAEVADRGGVTPVGDSDDVIGLLGDPVACGSRPDVCACRAAWAFTPLASYALAVAAVEALVVGAWPFVACGFTPARRALPALGRVAAANACAEPQRHLLAPWPWFVAGHRSCPGAWRTGPWRRDWRLRRCGLVLRHLGSFHSCPRVQDGPVSRSARSNTLLIVALSTPRRSAKASMAWP
jgi:hypothetical protein